jgi:predicted enzyme related to lactoylglutathione lyase
LIEYTQAATVTRLGGKEMGIDDSPFGRIAALADPSGAVFKVVHEPVPECRMVRL